MESFSKLNVKDKQKTLDALRILESGKPLPTNYYDHQLQGELSHLRECHIRGDLLLVYKVKNDILTITAINVGTHSQIF